MWEWNVKHPIRGVAEDDFVMCMCIYTLRKDSVLLLFKFYMSSLAMVI